MPTTEIPTISHPTGKVNFSVVNLDRCSFTFSYETLIAFYTPESGQVVSENAWSTVTGKHLNYIDGGSREVKAKRLPRGEFERLASSTFAAVSLAAIA